MIEARTESMYLVQSNKKKCTELLKKDSLSENEMIDFYISLHIVMEASLNAFFRNLSLIQIQKSVNKLQIAKNIDSISFIDKTTLFIYNYRYDFKGNIEQADEYHSIIGKLKNFSGVRNKLLHGHSISTLFQDGDNNQQSETRTLLDKEKIQIQIQLFKDIFKGLRFYLDHIDSSLTESGKESFKKEYLDDNFLDVSK